VCCLQRRCGACNACRVAGNARPGADAHMLVRTNKQTPSLLCHVVGFCMHARAHTGLQSYVTFFHGKRVEECYTSDSARASATNALVGPNTTQCGITGNPNHNTVMPPHALVYQLVLPCATILVHACCVRHSLYPAILLPQCLLPLHCHCLPHLPLLLACLNQKLRARRHPDGQGTEQTLSPLVRVLVSFEHEAGSFYTRHQNPYTVAT